MIFLAGCVASAGVLLIVAGTSKVYRSARALDGGSAIRRALRLSRARWRRVELAFGCLECVTGAVVFARLWPVPAAALMAVLGAVFCASLVYVRIRRVPGDCGCIRWRQTAEPSPVTWRAIARAALVLCAGAAGTLAPGAGCFGHPLFYVGLAAGGAVAFGLSVARALDCLPGAMRPKSAALRALREHETFATMASASGPFSDPVRYRRAGCTQEFWFTPAGAETGLEAVVFRMRHENGSLSVHASLTSPATASTAGSSSR